MTSRVFLIVMVCVACVCVARADQVEMVVSPFDAPASSQAMQRYEPLPLAPGEVGLFGTIDPVGFVVTDIRQVTLLDPAGEPVALLIDADSLLEEFGEIVAMRFAAVAPADRVSSDAPFVLQWGPDIDADNTLAPKYLPEPGKLSRYRKLAPPTPDTTNETSLATLRIIADSQADWYFLWYLVPLVGIVVLVILQAIHGLRSDH